MFPLFFSRKKNMSYNEGYNLNLREMFNLKIIAQIRVRDLLKMVLGLWIVKAFVRALVRPFTK